MPTSSPSSEHNATQLAHATQAAHAVIWHGMKSNAREQGGILENYITHTTHMTLQTHIQSAVELSRRSNMQQVILGFSTHAAVYKYAANYYPQMVYEKTKNSTAAFNVEQLNIQWIPTENIIELHTIPLTSPPLPSHPIPSTAQVSPSQTPLKRTPYRFKNIDECVAFIQRLKMTHIYLDMHNDFKK